MGKLGVVYVAIGDKAKAEAHQSIETLRAYNDLPITVIDKYDNSRWAKLNIDQLIDYDQALYLDADTRVRGDITPGFKILDAGWDLAIAFSRNQDADIFAHFKGKEKAQTINELGYTPLQLQAGVIFFDRRRCAALFEAWRNEWLRYKDQDQAALLRALDRCPVRVWLLGRAWNGGELIEHLQGKLR